MKLFLSALTIAGFVTGSTGVAQLAAPLKLVAKYKMPANIKGRFDHLTADLGNNRLLVTAETAHEVLVFDLRSGNYLRAISGIGIPHAIFFRDDLNRIYITDGGAGARSGSLGSRREK